MNKLAGGTALLGLSLFMLLGFVTADLKHQSFVVKSITFGFAVILPMGAGLGLLRSHTQQKQTLAIGRDQLRLKTLQAEVLKLAIAKNGTLTSIKVIAELAIEPDLSTKVLNSLVYQNIADQAITESGLLVYSFYDIQHLSEKNPVQGKLDV